MGKVIDHVSLQTLRQILPMGRIFWHRSRHHAVNCCPACLASRSRAIIGSDESNALPQSLGLAQDTGLPERNSVPRSNEVTEKSERSLKLGDQAYSYQSYSAHRGVPSGRTLPVIGTLPDHFAESVRLARNSQHSRHPASESQFRATWMLQDAAVVANCNTYNRNQPVRELRKGLFFRGRCHGAGIDSTSESFRTAFHTIYDLTGIHATGDCHLHANQISDNPRHAPSVQC